VFRPDKRRLRDTRGDKKTVKILETMNYFTTYLLG